MKLETIRTELFDVIREHTDRYWTGYSIWCRLKERFREQADELARTYTDGVGRGGGVHFGPVSYISRSLASVPDLVDRQWLNAKGLWISEHEASDDAIAIFRWKGNDPRLTQIHRGTSSGRSMMVQPDQYQNANDSEAVPPTCSKGHTMEQREKDSDGMGMPQFEWYCRVCETSND